MDQKIIHDDKILYQHMEIAVTTSSAWRNPWFINNSSLGGTGLIINRGVSQNICFTNQATVMGN